MAEQQVIYDSISASYGIDSFAARSSDSSLLRSESAQGMASSKSSMSESKENGVALASDTTFLESVETVAKASAIGFLVGSISGWLHISNVTTRDGDSMYSKKATIDVYGKEVIKSSKSLPIGASSFDDISKPEVQNPNQFHFDQEKLESKLSQGNIENSSRPMTPSSSASTRNSHLINFHNSMPRSSYTSAAAPPLQEEMARRVAMNGLQFGVVAAVMSSTLVLSQHVFNHDKDSIAFGAAGLTGGLAMGIVQRPFQFMSTIKKGVLLGSLTFGYSVMYDQFLTKNNQRKNSVSEK